jgi:hypothetical protein
MTPKGMAIADRLWAYIMPEPMSGCWLWTGNTNASGYGTIYVDHKSRLAHRVAYETWRSSPGDNLVCHKCDVRSCLNPDHLFLGDHAANKADSVSKRRHKNPTIRLTEADVVAIRDARADGERVKSIAARYGVARVTVHHIICGLRWAHVPRTYSRNMREK